MTTREERDAAIDQVNYKYIERLRSDLGSEQFNIETLISKSTEHIGYNPYMVMDKIGLQSEVDEIKRVRDSLDIVSDYQRRPGKDYTRTQHDVALDSIPSEYFLDLVNKLQEEKNRLEEICNSPMVKTRGNIEFISFDTDKWQIDYDINNQALNGMQVVYNFAFEQENPPPTG